MSPFYSALALGMVIGVGLATFTGGLLDLLITKDAHPDALTGLEGWKPSGPDPDQSRSGEIGQIILPGINL